MKAKKSQPTLDTLIFSTPEQKLLKFLLEEPTTSFIPRVLSSRLKGVRGLGGVEGISTVLKEFESLGLVDFVDNNRGVRLKDDSPIVHRLKVFAAVCDMEGVREQLTSLCTKGFLFGVRAHGEGSSDSPYELCVVTSSADEAQRIAQSHPLGKKIELTALTEDQYNDLDRKNAALAQRIKDGIMLWGSSW